MPHVINLGTPLVASILHVSYRYLLFSSAMSGHVHRHASRTCSGVIAFCEKGVTEEALGSYCYLRIKEPSNACRWRRAGSY
jgi:hypothetical protein